MAVRVFGLLATTLGAAALLWHPLRSPEMVGRPEYPAVPPGYVVLLSLALGPILVTLGFFSLREPSLRPLTLKRVLLAPLLALVAGGFGLARYVYRWEEVTPFREYEPSSPGNYDTVDPSVTDLFHRSIDVSHFVAIAVLGGFIVGVASARRGPRTALLGGIGWSVVLVGVILAPISADPSAVHQPLRAALFGVAFTAASFVAGYLGTASPDSRSAPLHAVRDTE